LASCCQYKRLKVSPAISQTLKDFKFSNAVISMDINNFNYKPETLSVDTKAKYTVIAF